MSNVTRVTTVRLDRKRLKSVRLPKWGYTSLLVEAAAACDPQEVAYASDGTRCQFAFRCDGPVLQETEFLTGALELAVESLLRSAPGISGLELRSGEWAFESNGSGRKQQFGPLAEARSISSLVAMVMDSWPYGFVLLWRCSMLGYIRGCLKHPRLFHQAFLEAGIQGTVDGESCSDR